MYNDSSVLLPLRLLAVRSSIRSHVLFHESNVVVLCKLPVFLQVRALVFRHALDKIVNELVGDERVSEVHLCYVWLQTRIH